MATLSSAACLSYLGRRIDDVDLRVFSVFVLFGLVGACWLLSSFSSLVVLVIALFGLRLFGQGLMSHTSNTATARYFDRQRGKALGLVNLGHPAGEAVLPLGLVAALAYVEWREFWQGSALFLIAIVLPLMLWLLRGHSARHRELTAELEENGPSDETPSRQWTGGEVLRDPAFYRVLPSALTPAFVMTGVFFHQDVLKGERGWSDELFASGFVAYAIAQVTLAPLAGAAVDRWSAERLLPFYLIPLVATLTAVALVPGPAAVFVLMAGAGISSGLGYPVVGSLWAERYGVLHLGAIRSQVSVLMVVSTAISPPLLGALIDGGATMRQILLGLAAGALVASALTWRRFRAGEPR